MRTLALEQVLNRYQAIRARRPVRYTEVRGHVGEQAYVDILEDARLNEERFRAEFLFRDAGPELNGAFEMLALHDLLHGERRQDVQRNTGIVAFAMSGSARDQGLMPGHGRLLRSLRYVVDVGTKRDDGLALAPRRNPRCWNADDIALYFEALFFENGGEVPGGFKFLETKFAEAEHAVDHHLRLFLHGIDLSGKIGLDGSLLLGRNLGCLRCGAGGAEEQGKSELLHERESP